MIKGFFSWVFAKEIAELQNQKANIIRIQSEFKAERKVLAEVTNKNIKLGIKFERKLNQLEGIIGSSDISIDHSMNNYSRSWAVISIQGEKTDFVKFIDLGRKDITDIQRFLQNFDRSKVDCAPNVTPFLRINRKGK
jgi:translation initiation factor 1 (eIF-1/SUI1)